MVFSYSPSDARKAIAKKEKQMTSSKILCAEVLEKAYVPLNSEFPWSIHVHNEKLWDRVIAQRTLGIAEAYIDGWWDCESVDQMVARIQQSGALSMLKPNLRMVATALRAMLSNSQTKQKARRNVQHHYDTGDDLYTRMLGETMAYSCGYWAHSDNLTSAQYAKFDLICRKLRLEPGMRVLDIGCGWGGFLSYAASVYGIVGIGITTSDNQVKEATRRTAGASVSIINMDYRDLTGTYDRIVSVGMFEHVGHKNYKEFFSKCDSLLAPDGTMLHHTIGTLRSKAYHDPFIAKYIFPGGQLPSLAQISKAAEPNWVIEDVHNIGQDYDKTLMAWHSNINALWHEIPSYSKEFQRMWNFYLLSCAGSFRSRNLQLWQIVMRKKGVADRYISAR